MDFFPSPLGLPQRHCWKSFKKIKANSFSGQGFGVGSPSTGTAQVPHEMLGNFGGASFVISGKNFGSPPCPEYLCDWPQRQLFKHCAWETSPKALIDPGPCAFQCNLWEWKAACTSNGNFLTRSATHLPICLSASLSVSLLFFAFCSLSMHCYFNWQPNIKERMCLRTWYLII